MRGGSTRPGQTVGPPRLWFRSAAGTARLTRDGTMKEDTRTAVKHEFEHAQPTVIHHPEEDMTILARWVPRGMQQGPKFWYLLAGVAGVIVLVSVLAGGLSRGRTS